MTFPPVTIPALAPLVLLGAVCATAAWLDLTTRRIPNWLCAATAVAGLGLAFVHGGPGALGNHALHMVIALAAGMALFATGGFGGGDAKFYAGVASWFALGQAVQLLVHIALSGLLLLIVWFIYRRIRGIPISRVRKDAFDGLPYGIAISLGAILAATV